MAEPSWRRLNPHLERDVRELVRHVAGLQDDADPNFQLCLHFAWSNFRWGARRHGARAVRFSSPPRRLPVGQSGRRDDPPNGLVVQLPDLPSLNT